MPPPATRRSEPAKSAGLQVETGGQLGQKVVLDYDPRGRFSVLDLVAAKRLLEKGLGVEVDVTTRKGLHPQFAESFANALLELDAQKPEHKAILDFLSATKYVRAKDSDYTKLRQAAKDAGLIK